MLVLVLDCRRNKQEKPGQVRFWSIVKSGCVQGPSPPKPAGEKKPGWFFFSGFSGYLTHQRVGESEPANGSMRCPAGSRETVELGALDHEAK